jgi:hypothetical protein
VQQRNNNDCRGLLLLNRLVFFTQRRTGCNTNSDLQLGQREQEHLCAKQAHRGGGLGFEAWGEQILLRGLKPHSQHLMTSLMLQLCMYNKQINMWFIVVHKWGKTKQGFN